MISTKYTIRKEQKSLVNAGVLLVVSVLLRCLSRHFLEKDVERFYILIANGSADIFNGNIRGGEHAACLINADPLLKSKHRLSCGFLKQLAEIIGA